MARHCIDALPIDDYFTNPIITAVIIAATAVPPKAQLRLSDSFKLDCNFFDKSSNPA